MDKQGECKDIKCKTCGCQFTISPHRGVDPALKALALVLYAYGGLSMSKIAQICKVSVVAVLKWIKGAALQVKPLTGESSSDIVMIDEVWHFVEGKKKKLGWQIGHRGDSRECSINCVSG